MARRPVASQKLPCIGGPLDGRVVSELDLPEGAVIKCDWPANRFDWVRRDRYERETVDGRDVWRWRERND